jgi:hypothetical protein
MRERSRWAWVDFNSGPPDLSNAQTWLCEAFVNSFQSENPDLDMSSLDVLKGILSRQIQRRKPIYEEVLKSNPESAARMRGEDLAKWQDDPLELTRGIGNYVMGVRHDEVLIVVMDNVDRLDLKSQLDTFQLRYGSWSRLRSFVILQMRGETYERFKDRPPLDTFRTGIAFHISPPLFINVVKKRLDLSISYLAANAADTQTYVLPSGIRISLPTTELGRFLHDLYIEIFEHRRNIFRILESLAGLNVRRARDMFIGIITSGHLREDQITSQVRGAADVRITENNILKILMRGEYRFFSDYSGIVSNIFALENEWKKPNNFLLGEILFYRAHKRRDVGQIGIEGYFSVEHICHELQRLGFDSDDTFEACKVLLAKYLVNADHMNNVSLELSDCIIITAAGYIHLRVLAERIEYLFGILPTTRIADAKVVDVVVDVVNRENSFGEVTTGTKIFAVRKFYDYLSKQAVTLAEQSGRAYDSDHRNSGTAYLLRQVHTAIEMSEARGNPSAKLERVGLRHSN